MLHLLSLSLAMVSRFLNLLPNRTCKSSNIHLQIMKHTLAMRLGRAFSAQRPEVRVGIQHSAAGYMAVVALATLLSDHYLSESE